MGAAIAQAGEPAADLAREVWSKGKRPVRGAVVRLLFAITMLLVGLLTPILAMRIACIVLGVGAFFVVPPLVDAYLDRLAAKLGSASKSEATRLLDKLEERRVIALFAPHAWVSLQKGRLHMILRDGRAAAIAFGEAARQLGNVEQPVLMAAQAQGFVLSGDRKLARELLAKLEMRDELRPWDRVNLGIVYVEEPGKTKKALEHLMEAKEVLGDHPRVQAALALAHARAGNGDEAQKWLDAAEENEALDDDSRDLLKRARKDLRSIAPSKPSKKKKAGESADAKPTAAPRKEKRKGKKDRRKERREKRDKKKSAESSPKLARADAEAEKRAEAERKAEADKRAEAERKAEADRKAEAARKAEADKRAEAERKAEADRKAEAARRAEADRKAEAARKAEAEKPTPPAVTFEGPDSKPVFRPPAVPPPPTVKAPTKDDAPAPSAPTSDGWDDILGDD